MLVDSLQAFRPELKDIFVCPVCLREVLLSDKSNISEAHILPKAAKGVMKTFLCVTCNSTFGAKQDKWFGEFLNIQKSGSIFAHSSKDVRSFSINGLKVNGTYRQENDGGLGFYIHSDRNPPDILKRLQSVRNMTPGEMTLNISFPILKNQHMVNVGFLTAGYLMWFGVLGYSWVFQDHLDIVRKQILNPEEKIIPVNYLAKFNQSLNLSPWVGIMPMANIMVPVMGVNDHVVIFPPSCHPQLYESMRTYNYSMSMSSIRKIGLGPEPTYGPAQSIMCNEDLIVFSGLKAKNNCHQVLWFRDGESEPQILYPISNAEYEKQSKLPNAIKVKVKGEKSFDKGSKGKN